MRGWRPGRRATLASWSLAWRFGGEAVVAGLGIGVVWVATSPGLPDAGLSDARIDRNLGLLTLLWLVLRGVGTIVMVPIAEELAFRGFLHRWLISRRFEAVPFRQISLMALLVSSALFGVLHDRWLAGALSGAVFAVLMNRSGRLSDPVAAHMTANAVIFVWAVVAWKPWLL